MKLLFSLIILTSSISSFSQEKNNEKVIDDFVTKIRGYKNISVEFNLLYENTNFDVRTNKQGKLIIEKDKFNLKLDEQTIINDGETQWTYLKDINEVQITKNEMNIGAANISDLFKISKNDYSIVYLKDQMNFQLFELIPKTIKSFIKIQIKIQKKDNLINEIKVFDKEGGKFIYSLKKFRFNQEVNSFYFDTLKYPGIEIIDLR